MKRILPAYIAQKNVIWELRKIILCNVSWIKALLKYKKLSIVRDTITYFPKYYGSIKRNNDPLNYDQPWIVFKAKEFLDSILKGDMTVWEYGSGSSTLYFARRVKIVYSIENDKEWFAHLNARIEAEHVKNVRYALIEAEKFNGKPINSMYISKSITVWKEGGNLKNYATSIDSITDNSLDIVLIDGRGRRACIAHAIPKIKQGGYLIVDNSDRDSYFEKNEILFDREKWEVTHFVGPVPYSFDFSKTSFFRKREDKR
jgi:predicted O-methyltransferase YrrM